MKETKKTGSFDGKSNALGHGGRAAQLRAKGVPEAVIGEIARKKQAAPGQKNYHGGEEKKAETKEPRTRKEPESLHDYHGHNRLHGK
jgi:hypothetical protein